MPPKTNATGVDIRPIGIDDVVNVRGRHLYKNDGTRFIVRGIAFPTPPVDSHADDDGGGGGGGNGAVDEPPSSSNSHHRQHGYDPQSWLSVLRQLRLDLNIEFNTVRLYRLHPDVVDYSDFFVGAAELGIYVIVPLTSAAGDGVLDRNARPPYCYPRQLYEYGTKALMQYMKYTNVLAGIVGNEVMDETFVAAPCVRAYSRDMKMFMRERIVEYSHSPSSTNGGGDDDDDDDDGGRKDDGDGSHVMMRPRMLPLIYASQDSSPVGGAALDKDVALKLTLDYLTCVSPSSSSSSSSSYPPQSVSSISGMAMRARGGRDDGGDIVGTGPVDIMGINVESWCSSTQEYTTNRDGTPGPYYHLHEALVNTSVPIMFTEMGCPHSQYDRDDPFRKTPGGIRDWADVTIVEGYMSDTWSGYVAYAYDGPTDFVMTSGGPWNGIDVLDPTADMYNFKMRVDESSDADVAARNGDEASSSPRVVLYIPPRRCDDVIAELLSCCDVRVYDDDAMVPYTFDMAESNDERLRYPYAGYALASLVVFVVCSAFARWGPWRRRRHPVGGDDHNMRLHHRNGDGGDAKYGAIALS